MNREIQALLRQLRQQHWDIRHTRRGHYRVTSPDGRTVTLPSTPSDKRSVLNARAGLRRLGAQV